MLNVCAPYVFRKKICLCCTKTPACVWTVGPPFIEPCPSILDISIFCEVTAMQSKVLYQGLYDGKHKGANNSLRNHCLFCLYTFWMFGGNLFSSSISQHFVKSTLRDEDFNLTWLESDLSHRFDNLRLDLVIKEKINILTWL